MTNKCACEECFCKDMVEIMIWALGVSLTIIFMLMLQFTAASVIIAAGVLFYNMHRNFLKDAQENSKFYLEKYIKSFEMVLERLISDKPTRRIAWVSAASIAEKLISIEEKITEKPDKDFLEIYQRNFAHLLMEVILEKPSTYFYGIDDPKGSDDLERLDDAAGRSMENHGVVFSGNGAPRFKSYYVDEKQIAMILKMTDSTWIKEGGNACVNGEKLILSVLKFNYPNVYEYIQHYNSCEKFYDKEKGFILKRGSVSTHG